MSTVATFHVDYVQFLDWQGKVTQPLPDFALDPQALIKLYKIMRLTRTLDTKAVALQRTGKIGTYASTLGQEAIGAALGYMMRKADVLVPFYRDYAAQLQRGVQILDLYRFWGGDERGSASANCHDLPISVPIASQCLHATGVAKAFQLRKQNRVAVSTCGDGATSEGDFYEAINVAGVWNLPVIFVVNNNQWAISVPRKKQTGTLTLAQKAIAAGFAGIQVDGNDVIALSETIHNALEKARQGNGPTLIEAITYRLCDHTTADDASRYRPNEELTAAEQKEPIARLYNYLIEQSHWSEQQENKLLQTCKQQVEAAALEFANSEPQPITAIFDYHYANIPLSLMQQRDQATQSLVEE